MTPRTGSPGAIRSGSAESLAVALGHLCKAVTVGGLGFAVGFSRAAANRVNPCLRAGLSGEATSRLPESCYFYPIIASFRVRLHGRPSSHIPGAASPIHKRENFYLCKSGLLIEAYSIHTDLGQGGKASFLPTHSSNKRQHLQQTLRWGYCNCIVPVTLICLTPPFATSYGTRQVPNANKRKFLFPHDETSLGVTRISCQQQKP